MPSQPTSGSLPTARLIRGAPQRATPSGTAASKKADGLDKTGAEKARKTSLTKQREALRDRKSATRP